MESKVAIVTGGADGIGKELARKYLSNQYEVAIFDVSEKALQSTAQEFQRLGNFLPLLTNVADEASVTDSVAQVIRRFSHIDILVNNAGGSMAVSQEVERIAAADWDKVINVNLRGAFLCAKAVIPAMKERKSGRIVNMASVAGRGRSFFGGTPYAAAKAGVIGFTRQASRELGKFGITINAVAPGVVISGARISDYWHNKKTEEERNALLSLTPLGRMGVPADIVEVVYFLTSDGGSYITGAVIDVNGGQWVG
jgi:NAD(P)-dependent dehydrogenase (short-subunit alcohol dehydrogenase family)